ncbi:TPA: restriction endonuclease subunit S [Streptococcus suis]|nr:restriction endonuclease subunit S [Streptococcus suis]
MKTNNNIPAYRFQGYTDAWELRKLGEVARFRRGSFPQPYGNSEWYDGDGAMPFVQVADVTDEMNLVGDTKQKISRKAQPLSVFAEEGSVLVTLQGSIGRVAITQYGAFIDRTVLIFENFNLPVDNLFWAYIIKQKFIEEAKCAPGGTIKTITKEVLSDFDIKLPSHPEQEAIGTFFSTLDQQITLHQRKLDTLKEQKKTYLKLLFPVKGQTKPALRFQGFEDDWEEVKLGEVVNIQKGTQRGKQEISEIQSEQFPYPVYNGGQNVSGYTDEYNRENMVIVSEGGASAGYVNYYSGKFWSGGHNFSIDNLDNNLLFIKSILEFNQQKLYELKVGSGLPNVQLGSINQFVLSIPSLPEQEAIGTFFQTLDQELAQVEDKLASLKEMKKTLLRKLFV